VAGEDAMKSLAEKIGDKAGYHILVYALMSKLDLSAKDAEQIASQILNTPVRKE